MSFLSQPIQNIFIRPARKVGSIALEVVVSENTTDTLTVTKQPVQQGATISDHAFLEPVVFAHAIYFAAPGFTGGKSLTEIYNQLRALQATAEPFAIVTPKRIYNDMLMTTLTLTTDSKTENCLAIHASYQQINRVTISAATVPRINQRTPARTAGTEPTGNKQSILSKVTGG